MVAIWSRRKRTCRRAFVPGEKRSDGAGIDPATTRNVQWVARLGSETYSSPVVAGGRVFIGTNDFEIGDPRYQSTQGGLLLCLDEASGNVLWRLVVPKLKRGRRDASSTR